MIAHNNKILGEGLTYDDVLLVPAFSEVLPREVFKQNLLEILQLTFRLHQQLWIPLQNLL